MDSLRSGLLVDDAIKTTSNNVSVFIFFFWRQNDLVFVLNNRAITVSGVNTLQNMWLINWTSVCNATVRICHLKTGYQQVALANSKVTVVTTLPLTSIIRRAGKVIPLPLSIWNTTRRLFWKVNTRKSSKSKGTECLLHTLGMIVVVEEALTNLIKNNVARVSDTSNEVNSAMARKQPAVHTVLLAKSCPKTCAIPAGISIANAVLKSSKGSKRLNGRTSWILAGNSAVHQRVVCLFRRKRIPVRAGNTANKH